MSLRRYLVNLFEFFQMLTKFFIQIPVIVKVVEKKLCNWGTAGPKISSGIDDEIY